MFTIPKWVVYGIVSPTLVESPKFIVESPKKYGLYMAIDSRNLKNIINMAYLHYSLTHTTCMAEPNSRRLGCEVAKRGAAGGLCPAGTPRGKRGTMVGLSWVDIGYLWLFTYWCLVGNGWEWGNGIIIDSYCGSFPRSLLSTSKFNIAMENAPFLEDLWWFTHEKWWCSIATLNDQTVIAI